MELMDYKKNDILIVSIKGRLDASTADQLRQKLRQAIEEGTLKIILDCKNLEYISSSGLRVFYEIMHTLEEKTGKLVVANPHPEATMIFEIVALNAFIPILKDVDDAVKQFLS